MSGIKEKVEDFVKNSFDKLGINVEEVIVWQAEKDKCSFDVLAKNENVYTFNLDTKDFLMRVLDNKLLTKKDLNNARQIYSYKEL